MERNGAARSRGPLGSPSAPSNKTGLPPSLGSWLQAANRIPTTPARGTDPGLSPYCIRLRRTAQPTLIGAYDGRRTRTSDHTSRSRRRRSPVPRSRDASKPALSKCREPNPASVFHRRPKTQQTERKPKPHNRRWNIRLWRTEENASVSLTYRTSTHRRRPPPQCCIIARGPRGHVVGSRRAAS